MGKRGRLKRGEMCSAQYILSTSYPPGLCRERGVEKQPKMSSAKFEFSDYDILNTILDDENSMVSARYTVRTPFSLSDEVTTIACDNGEKRIVARIFWANCWSRIVVDYGGERMSADKFCPKPSLFSA